MMPGSLTKSIRWLGGINIGSSSLILKVRHARGQQRVRFAYALRHVYCVRFPLSYTPTELAVEPYGR
jgi:hypothetical protein